MCRLVSQSVGVSWTVGYTVTPLFRRLFSRSVAQNGTRKIVVGQSIGGLFDRLVSSLVAKSVAWSVGRLVSRAVGKLVG